MACWLVAFLAVAAICVAATCFTVQRRGGKVSLQRLDLDIVPSPKARWLIGHVEMLAPNFHRKLSAWADELGGVFRIRVFGMDGLVVTDPVAVGNVLGHEQLRELPKHAVIYQILDQLWGDGTVHSIFTDINTDKWKLVRKAVLPAFSSNSIKQKFDTVCQKTQDLARAIAMVDPQQAVDIDDAGMRLTLDIVGLAGFDHDFNSVSLKENRVIASLPRALKELQKRMTNPFQVLSWSQESRAAMKCAREFRAICETLVAELRARGPPQPCDTSIGAQLLRARDAATGRGLTDRQLQAEVGTFVMGGFETTAHTLSFTLFSIATNPSVEAKLVEELAGLGLLGLPGKPARQLQHEDLRKLVYTGNVIKEAMRKYPVVAGLPRLTDGSTRIGPYMVPKGVFVYVLFHHLHNNSQLWQTPDRFWPERWNHEDGAYHPSTVKLGQFRDVVKQSADMGVHIKVTADTSGDIANGSYKKFLPFSDGPRSCPGQAMALMELKTAVALLCSKFSFRLADSMGGPEGVMASEVMALTLHTHNGIHLHCLPRDMQ